MSARFNIRHNRTAAIRIIAIAILSGITAFASAQQTIAPKVEIFGGYSYLYPNATITGTLPGGIVPVDSCMCGITKGVGVVATYDFNRWLGLTADWSGHWSPKSTTPSLEIGRANLFTYSAGPKFTYRTNHFAPFAEVLVGAHNLAPELFTADTKFGLLAGGGLDWMATRHFGVRLVQADYVVSNHHFGTQASTANTDLRGVRLQAGVLFTFGGSARPIIVPAAAPAPEAAPVVIAAPAPAPAPLTLTCSANPSSVMAGNSSTITANATSTRTLTYSYSASAGAISGSTNTAILNTASAAAGTIDVTCNVVDDLGQTASQTVPVIVTALPIAVAIQTSPLCTVSFARDQRRPARVDNEAKACLDDIALSMQRDSGAQLILVGNASAAHHDSTHLAARRDANTKAYLVTDKGIEPGRIKLYTGTTGTDDVNTTLAPSGSTPDLTSDSPVDETQ